MSHIKNKTQKSRAFRVRVELGGFLTKKVKSITITDGINSVTLSPFDYFVIYTDKPMTEAIIKHR